MNKGQIHRGRGLVDLIAGVTPTLSGWTNDPTDAADITDDDISTFCTTGDKVAGAAYQYAYFEWDLGAFYNILCSGVGGTSVSVGSAYTRTEFYNGSAWVAAPVSVSGAYSDRCALVTGATCNKIRLGLASNAAATITPNIREFHAWRL